MTTLATEDLVIRIGLALLIGLVLGFERERHGHAAGMRTTMLVCVASSIAMLLSEYLYTAASVGNTGWRPDPARLAQGVLAGMGFLGAGVIIKHDQAIHGVTTAALLWFTAILGMAVGAGYLGLALGGFTVAMTALFILPQAEQFIASDRYAILSVWATLKGPEQSALIHALESLELTTHIKPTQFNIDKSAKTKQMVFEIKVKKNLMRQCQVESIECAIALSGVKKVQWT